LSFLIVLVLAIIRRRQDIRLFGASLTAGPNGITPIDSIDLPYFAAFGLLDLRPW